MTPRGELNVKNGVRKITSLHGQLGNKSSLYLFTAQSIFKRFEYTKSGKSVNLCSLVISIARFVSYIFSRSYISRRLI